MKRSIPNARSAGVFSICLALALLGAAATASAQFAAFGPPNQYNFPSYYEDGNGLRLKQCVDVNDPLCLLDPLPDPGQPPSVATGNFWGESFYHRVLADINLPGGGIAQLVIALESIMFNDPIIQDGDQIVFARLRFRLDTVNDPNTIGTYTITHPYGVDTFEVTTPGLRAINFTDDCLGNGTCTPGVNAFTTPLLSTSRLGPPFLVWDPAFGPAPPAGHIGDINVLHRITGSPFGTNFFRVEGPNVGGPGVNVVETNLFNVLGKLAPICGNGIVEDVEQCDDGNLTAGDCCSPTCTFEPALQPCEDGNFCTRNTTCNGAGVCGVISGNNGLACDDGDACTTGDRCVGANCVPTGAVNCNDGDVCTDDSCDTATGLCANVFNTAPCDDLNGCTTGEACDGAGQCVGGTLTNCNDLNPCTDDICDGTIGCVSTPNADPCDDANVCTTGEACTGGLCTGGTVTVCDDANPCTNDTCDPVLGCRFTNNTLPCDDGLPCTLNDTCLLGVCVGTPVVGECVCATTTIEGSSALPLSGQSTTLNVVVDAATNVLGAYNITYEWDPVVLNLDSVLGGTSIEFSGPPLCNVDAVAGTATCSATNGLSLTTPTGIVNVARLNFTALNVSGGSTDVTARINSLVDTDAQTIIPCNGLDLVTLSPLCGDVDGSGSVGVVDALFVAQYQVGLRTCTGMSRPELCNVNPDGINAQCNIGDALKMAQCSVGLISCDFACDPWVCP